MTPILNDYDIIGIPVRFGMVLLFGSGLLMLFMANISPKLLISVVFLILIIFLSQLAVVGASTHMISRLMLVLLSVFIVFVLPQFLNYDDLRFSMMIVLLCAAGFLMFQIFLFRYYGTYPSLVLDNAIFYSHTDVRVNITAFSSGQSVLRPSSFFNESSRFGLFLGFFFHFCILGINGKRRLIFAYSLGILVAVLSTSGTAIALIVASLFFKVKSLSGMVSKSVIAIAGCLLLAYFFTSSLGYGFERFLMSGSRVFNGLDAFSNLDYMQHMFGVGLGHGQFIMAQSEFPFTSGFALALLELGLVGTAFLLFFIVGFIYRLKSLIARQFVYLWLACLIFEQVLFGFWFVLPMLLAVVIERKNYVRNKVINFDPNERQV